MTRLISYFYKNGRIKIEFASRENGTPFYMNDLFRQQYKLAIEHRFPDQIGIKELSFDFMCASGEHV